MTVTFENENEIIVHALGKIIAYTRTTQRIFLAQCIWWLASAIGLEPGLVKYIDNLHGRTIAEEPIRSQVDPLAPRIQKPSPEESLENQRDKVLEECVEYFKESRRLRDIATLKSKGKTLSGQINPTPISNKALRQKDRYKRKQAIPAKKESRQPKGNT
jgi:hypothetical protein